MLCNKTSYNLEHAKGTLKEAECVSIQVSVSSLLRNRWQCSISRDWVALLLPPRLLLAAPIVATIQNLFCLEDVHFLLQSPGYKARPLLVPFCPNPTLNCETWLVCPRSVCKAAALWAFSQVLHVGSVSVPEFHWGMSILLHCIWVFSVSNCKVFGKKIPSCLSWKQILRCWGISGQHK